MDFDAMMISASQLGRDAWEKIRNNKPLGQDDIQGGMSKINTSDVVIAVIRDDAMIMSNQVRFQYLKTRNSGGVGKFRMLTWNPVSLRIKDMTEEGLTQNAVNQLNGKRPALNKPLNAFGLTNGGKT
jgi:hypothetical protein